MLTRPVGWAARPIEPLTQARLQKPLPLLPAFQGTLSADVFQRQTHPSFRSPSFILSASPSPIPFGLSKISPFFGMAKESAPSPVGFQCRVEGVTRFQRENPKSRGGNINALAEGGWSSGEPLEPSPSEQYSSVLLKHPKYGPVGWLPREITDVVYVPPGESTFDAAHVYTLHRAFRDEPQNMQVSLNTLLAGKSAGAPTIGMKVSVRYTGTNPHIRGLMESLFDNPKTSEEVRPEQPSTSPLAVFDRIKAHTLSENGQGAVDRLTAMVQELSQVLLNPAHQRILILGHILPDGDALGSIVGLKHALDLLNLGKTVDCAVDDQIPGLFRDKMPGIETVKRPPNPERLAAITQEIEKLEKKLGKGTDPAVERQLLTLSAEKTQLTQTEKLLNLSEPYDVVVMLDTPGPTRFTHRFKGFLDQAKEVIYIDHHPFKLKEWETAKGKTGVQMKSLHQKGRVWVEDSVAAAAQLVGVLIQHFPVFSGLHQPDANPALVFPTEVQQQQFQTMVAALVTGMITDTGWFSRVANWGEADMDIPVDERPDFRPEGQAKWYLNFSKSLPANPKFPEPLDMEWFWNNIEYDIPDNPLDSDQQMTARKAMLQSAVKGFQKNQAYLNQGLGILQVPYEDVMKVLHMAQESDMGVTKLDVQNAYKYSPIMSLLRSNPLRYGYKDVPGPVSFKNYRSALDSDRIAILMVQDQPNLNQPELKSIRFSFRSQQGTNYAEWLATLFGGGGHGAAAGGGLTYPNLTFSTPLTVKVNGKPTIDGKTISKALQHNYELNHDELGHKVLAAFGSLNLMGQGHASYRQEWGRVLSQALQESAQLIHREVPQALLNAITLMENTGDLSPMLHQLSQAQDWVQNPMVLDALRVPLLIPLQVLPVDSLPVDSQLEKRPKEPGLPIGDLVAALIPYARQGNAQNLTPAA